MIKINLLPVRVSKKKETALQQILIFCGALLLVVLLMLGLYFYRGVQIATTRQQIQEANSQISLLKAKIGKIEELKTLKEQVKKKLAVLEMLRKNKTGPAQRLASLSDATPDQLWLTGYSESNADIKINGMATTEDLIAQFMRALEASSDFKDVELVLTEQSEVSGVKLKRFELSMKLESFQLPVEEKPVAQKKP